MSDVREVPAVLESAAQAAAIGDLAAADALLHQALRLQQASLGPDHPDLASTLNNLAVVCEMANRPTEAEAFYRRAYGIASAALDPGDPRVATSLDNLRAFCQAHGVAVPTEQLPALPATTPTIPEAAPSERPPDPVPAGVADHHEPQPTPPAPPPEARSSRTAVVGALAALALAAALTGAWLWSQADRDAGEAPPTAPAPESIPAQPSDAAPPAASSPSPAAAHVDPPAEKAAARPAPDRDTDITVLDAKVCRSLSTEGAEWRCVAPSNPAAPGPLSFYTRIAASADGRVHHRWYRDNNLVRDVALTVRANPTAGYRTYSRQTVDASGEGEWRLEVRSPDGALLREERIVVR